MLSMTYFINKYKEMSTPQLESEFYYYSYTENNNIGNYCVTEDYRKELYNTNNLRVDVIRRILFDRGSFYAEDKIRQWYTDFRPMIDLEKED